MWFAVLVGMSGQLNALGLVKYVSSTVASALTALQRHQGMQTEIEEQWIDPTHHALPSWFQHLDINSVMLATSLLPTVFLEA
jgi:trehalose/maltose hydrolase-like predicted phosphorylase